MSQDLQTFRTFRSREEAEEFVSSLAELGFDARLEDNRALVSAAFIGPSPDYFAVRLAQADFIPAEHALDAEADRLLADVDPEHYLFGFNDEELLDVLKKADEWNAFDRRLARRILADRGLQVPQELVERMVEKRTDDLGQPAPPQILWVAVGYVLALVGGLIGVFIGHHLNTAKKTMPNGERVYVYCAGDRQHGAIMFFGGSVLFVTVIIVWLSRL
jgi:hypothetical protein